MLREEQELSELVRLITELVRRGECKKPTLTVIDGRYGSQAEEQNRPIVSDAYKHWGRR